MNRYLLLSLSFLTGSAVYGADPVVSNVVARQLPKSRQVSISYDVADADGDTLVVSVQLSSDGGTTFAVPARTFSGDIGKVRPGRGKRIVWDAGVDLGEAVGSQYRARVVASDAPAGMVQVPAGSFAMGWNSGASDASPIHEVYLDAFWIDRYEVTNEQYQVYVRATGSAQPFYASDNDLNGPQQPVVGVLWFDAEDYCTWAGKRLPTEAEWEKSARGTDGRTYPWGEGLDASRANYGTEHWQKGDNSDMYFYPAPVGEFPRGVSPYGAHDMAGNVNEWVADWYDRDYYSSLSTWRNPKGPDTGEYRVARGGSWALDPYFLQPYIRHYTEPATLRTDLGFRCARSF